MGSRQRATRSHPVIRATLSPCPHRCRSARCVTLLRTRARATDLPLRVMPGDGWGGGVEHGEGGAGQIRGRRVELVEGLRVAELEVRLAEANGEEEGLACGAAVRDGEAQLGDCVVRNSHVLGSTEELEKKKEEDMEQTAKRNSDDKQEESHAR